MARKDVIKYFLEQQMYLFEAQQDLKDVYKDYKGKLIDEDTYNRLVEQLTPQVTLLKENYERLAFIIALLNEPKRNKKKDRYRKENKDVYNYLRPQDKDAVNKESEDALAEIKKLIKGVKHDS